MGFEPEPSKEGSWMMAQNDLVVVGIDVAKDKVDACIRSQSLRQTSPSTVQGMRKLIAWLLKHGVSKAVMEASGGIARRCAHALRAGGRPGLGEVGDKFARAVLAASPSDDGSGPRRGEGNGEGGSRKVRSAFFMHCVGPDTRHNPVLKAFSHRLLAKGKANKVALIACI